MAFPNSNDNDGGDTSKSINYKNCSWIKAAGLLFSEYICLATLSFPWSFSVLGIIPGLLLTVGLSFLILYTGFIITDFCVLHPDIITVCDIGQHLFWGSKVAWWFTAFCFVANNTLTQALHILTGAEFFNTITNNTTDDQYVCSLVYSAVAVVICWVVSLPRTFHGMSFLAYFAAATMFVAILLTIIFAALEDRDTGTGTSASGTTTSASTVTWSLWPMPGTTYVDAMVAALNILYTLSGQIAYPSFISQMERPQDFKKSVVLVASLELVLFSLAGAIVYVYVGNEGMSSFAIGALSNEVYKKVAFCFAVPTVFYLGGLYCNVTAQFIFRSIFGETSRHRTQHTVKGWLCWGGINMALWLVGFVLCEVIPFFSDLLSLMSSLFDSQYSGIFWGVAFFQMRRMRQNSVEGRRRWVEADCAPAATEQKEAEEEEEEREQEQASSSCSWLRDKCECVIAISLLLLGLYLLGPGTYAVVQSIINGYAEGEYGSPFTCKTNAV